MESTSESAWATDPVTDSEDALRQLCIAVSAPVQLDTEAIPGGNRPLGGPSVEGVTALDQAVIDHVDALREALAGAAALIAQRTRDLDGAVAEQNRRKANDDSLADVLTRVGKDVLRRVLDGRS